jgi:DNA polymerase III subunit delta'
MSVDLPEPDRIEGAPHPRETIRLFGHPQAEAAFLEAHATGRRHHAWLITGPRGVGKATLAWRIARFLLAGEPAEAALFGAPPPPGSLDVSPDHPVSRRLLALSEPRNFLLRRGANEAGTALAAVIRIEETARLRSFLQLSAADGGERTIILDAADEMNPNAANAILKMLEEPPRRTTFLLVSHQPSRLLPTIRSRCRTLRLSSLAPQAIAAALEQAGVEVGDPVALAELSGGSVGEAIRLVNLDGMAAYGALIGLFRPRLNRAQAIRLAESFGGRANEPKLDLMLRLFDLFLSRLARAALSGPPAEAVPGEADLMARFAPGPEAARTWAEAQDTLGGRLRHGKAVNLDPAVLILDTLLRIDQTAASLSAR